VNLITLTTARMTNNIQLFNFRLQDPSGNFISCISGMMWKKNRLKGNFGYFAVSAQGTFANFNIKCHSLDFVCKIVLSRSVQHSLFKAKISNS
jgi:hypothetical protein